MLLGCWEAFGGWAYGGQARDTTRSAGTVGSLCLTPKLTRLGGEVRGQPLVSLMAVGNSSNTGDRGWGEDEDFQGLEVESQDPKEREG